MPAAAKLTVAPASIFAVAVSFTRLRATEAPTPNLPATTAALGVAVTSGLTGDLCWAVSCYGAGNSVRIKALDPAEF